MELGRFDEARDAFQKTIDTYSDSEWAAPAKYQLALATAKAFPGAEYDSTYLEEAANQLDEFIENHPEADISSQAQTQLTTLRNNEAKKIFEIAEFYEKQQSRQNSSADYRQPFFRSTAGKAALCLSQSRHPLRGGGGGCTPVFHSRRE